MKRTRSFRNGKARPVSTAVLRYVRGYSDHWAPWQAGKYEKGVRYHFRLAFKKPVHIGSVLGGLGRFSYLKPDAPYPGDPANPKHWVVVKGSGFTTLPPKVKTRAVLAAGESYWDQTLRCWWFYRDRLYSVSPEANAHAQKEFYRPHSAINPVDNRARNVIHGGEWRSGGKTQEGNLAEPPVSDINSIWFALTWQKKQPVRCLLLNTNQTEARVYTYNGPAKINPITGASKP